MSPSVTDAEILATGSELLGPDRVDTNSLWLTERLDECGVQVRRKTVVGDDLARMQEALEDALRRADLVLCTGGLGPTDDDVTREAAARATGRRLEFVAEVAEELRRRFAARGFEMPENNLRQAQVPLGAEVLPNRVGTAPGLRLRLEGRLLVLLPGPPREMRPMFSEQVLPEIRLAASGSRVARRVLKVTGLTESGMDALIGPVGRTVPSVAVTVNFTAYDLEVRLSARGAHPEADLDLLEPRLLEVLGRHVFSRTGETMEQVVRRLLAGRTLAVGEVASAGRVLARLGEGAGFVGRAVRPRPVDQESALEAARAVRSSLGADLGLVVGEARPSGERAEAWLALAGEGGEAARPATLPLDEDLQSRRASQAALDLLRRHLEEPWST